MSEYIIIGSKLSREIAKKLSGKVRLLKDFSPLAMDEASSCYLNEMLKSEHARYLIIDLYSCLKYLYFDSKELKTYSNDVVLTEKDRSLYDPVLSFTPSMRKSLNKFISIILSQFDKDNIILIESFLPNFYIVGNQQLREYKGNDYKKKKRVFLKKVEKNIFEIYKCPEGFFSKVLFC